MKFLVLFSLVVVMALVACRPAPTLFARATPSTPVVDLPVALAASTQPAIMPTPVALSVIVEADAEYLLLTNIYERSADSIVNIEVRMPSSALYPQGEQTRGSGFVYDDEGHIITNAHVIAEAEEVRVTFHDGTNLAAKVVGYDSYSDLGVISVNPTNARLLPLELGESAGVRVGQRAITIGNPFGLSASMSVGIISGIGRTLRSAELVDENALPGFQNPSILQIDAPINPGSSGGPLLNSEGLVVGVTTAIRTESGVFAGVGFAVPSATVKRVVPQLIENGRVEYPWLGISVGSEDNGFGVAGLAETLNLPVEAGVMVRGVTVGSPADNAGVRGGSQVIDVRGEAVCVGGDIIVAINETYVTSMDALTVYLVEQTRVGDTVTLRVVRDQQTFDVPVKLLARPDNSGDVKDCVR
jgi:2-alkenal reductase